MKNRLSKELFKLLPERSKKVAVLLTVTIFVAAVLEAVTIGAAYPLLTKLFNETDTRSDASFQLVDKILGRTDVVSDAVIVGIIAFLLIFSLAVRFLLNAIVSFLAFNLIKTLSSRALYFVMETEYTWVSKFDKTNLQATIINEINNLVGGVIMPCLKLVNTSFLTIWLIVVAFIIDVRLTIILITAIFVFGILFSFGFKGTLMRLSRIKVEENSRRLNQLDEIIAGIKLIKVTPDRTKFYNDFSASSHKYSRSIAKGIILSTVPKFTIEITIILILMLLFLFRDSDYILSNEATAAVLTTFGILGARLYPNLQLLYSLYSIILSNFGSVERVFNFFQQAESKIEFKNSQEGYTVSEINQIEFDQVCVGYSESAINSVPISCCIQRGTHCVLTGPSGSGKTAFIDGLIGYSNLTSGKIFIDKRSTKDLNLEAFRSKIAYVTQTPHILRGSILDNIYFKEKKGSYENALLSMKLAGLAEFVDHRNKNVIKDRLIFEGGTNLSGGQRQRLAIARALYRKPSVLILDEITSALDADNEFLILDTINKIKKDVIILSISHSSNYIKSADMVVKL